MGVPINLPSSDTLIVILSIVLVVLTLVLVWLGITTSREIEKLNRVSERIFHLGKIFAGGTLEETVRIPISWVEDNYQSIIEKLSKTDGVDARLIEEEIEITYRLNQESEILKIILEKCKQPDRIKEKLSLFTKL